MKTKLLGVLLLVASAAIAQLSVAIRIGAPPPVRVVRVQPRSPGAEYLWVKGYWYPVNNRYRWHEGYWTRPAYIGAHWVEPRHDGERYFDGYWDGDRGRVAHDHRWDKDPSHNRDYHHDK